MRADQSWPHAEHFHSTFASTITSETVRGRSDGAHAREARRSVCQ